MTIGDHRINSDIDLFMLTDDSAVVRDMTEDIPFDRKLRPVIVEPLELTMMERNDKEFLAEIRKGLVMWEQLVDLHRQTVAAALAVSPLYR